MGSESSTTSPAMNPKSESEQERPTTMFSWFKKRSSLRAKSVTPCKPKDDAEIVVQAFVDIMAAGTPYIGNAADLPFPRTVIKNAFSQRIDYYEGMRKYNKPLFLRNGFDETLSNMLSLYGRIDDWHDIDPEDLEAVSKLNQVQGPPPESALPLIGKYMQRSLEQ